MKVSVRLKVKLFKILAPLKIEDAWILNVHVVSLFHRKCNAGYMRIRNRQKDFLVNYKWQGPAVATLNRPQHTFSYFYKNVVMLHF